MPFSTAVGGFAGKTSTSGQCEESMSNRPACYAFSRARARTGVKVQRPTKGIHVTTFTKKSSDVSTAPVSDAEAGGPASRAAEDDSCAGTATNPDGTAIPGIDRSPGTAPDDSAEETLDPVSRYLWSQSPRSVH